MKSKRERSFKGVLDRQKHIAYEIGDTTTRSTTMGAAGMDAAPLYESDPNMYVAAPRSFVRSVALPK